MLAFPFRTSLVAFFAALLLGSAVTPSSAQRLSRLEQTETNVNAHYYYVQSGTPTIKTAVLGTVRHPGYYIISQGTRLDDLVALSGGAILDDRQRRDRRMVTFVLQRSTSQGQRVVYETTTAATRVDLSNAPRLMDGDVLTVEVTTRRRFGLRDTLTVVNTLALVALAVERFASL